MYMHKSLNEVTKHLRLANSSIRCQELTRILESLGFDVRNGKKQGHKVFVHHGLDSFTSGGYSCGHGKNPEVKPVYIKKIARLLKQYENELIQYSREAQ